MNEHTTIGHNSKSKTKLPDKFKPYGKQFDAIRDLAIESDQYVLDHHEKMGNHWGCYMFLVKP